MVSCPEEPSVFAKLKNLRCYCFESLLTNLEPYYYLLLRHLLSSIVKTHSRYKIMTPVLRSIEVILLIRTSITCAGRESFVRGESNFDNFTEGFLDDKYHLKLAIIGPPAKFHLIDLVIFQGKRPILLRNPIAL